MEKETFITLVLSVISLGWLATLSFSYMNFVKKGKELFSGTKKGNIYEIVDSYLVKVRSISKENEKIKEDMKVLYSLFKNSFQKIGIMRYNPFKDVGGDLSFSIALLDYHDNGIVITNIHGRGGNSIYAKPVRKGISDHNLSDEEQTAIKKAIKISEGGKEKNV